MKIPIDIRIRSERICNDLFRRDGDPETERDYYLVSGFMRKTKNGYRIEYREKDADDVTTTIDTFDDDSVALSRTGSMHSQMVFADGKSHMCINDLGQMPVQMRVNTTKLANSLSMRGGKLDIDYTIEIVGNLAEKNKLRLSVSPDKSIIRS